MATVRATIERARQALIGGKADQALGPCQEVLAVYPRHVEASCLLAETRRELRQLPQAHDLFERVVAADPESLIGHWGLATILEERGDPEGALYELQIAWDVSPGQPAVADEVRRLRGALGWEAEQVELSRPGLARVWSRGHQYRRALAEARRALAATPERLDLMVLEAECLWRLGRVEEAADVAADILLESPDCLKANLIRGFARVDAGARGAAEARKLLSRALSLDPECVVAAGLFPDGPLGREEVELDGNLRTPLVGETTEPAQAQVSRVAAVEAEPVVAATELVAARTVTPTGSALRPGDGPDEGATTVSPMEPEPDDDLPEHALTPVPSQAEMGPSPARESAASEPELEPIVAATPPVPTWLAKSETPDRTINPHGLDPELYAEWGDLLGEEVELDPDSVARLEAALSEATGGSGASGAWREVVLDRDALTAELPAESKPHDPPRDPAPASEPVHSESDLTTALAAVRAIAAAGDDDASAGAYRQLLRAHAGAAREVVDELAQLIEVSPDHGGLRRALGDAYMRSGRFQKAIEEYNRAAAAVRQPAAVA